MDYGPIITAAFSSKNENDVYCLRRLMCDMIERSPQKNRDRGLSDYSSNYDSDARSTSGVSASARSAKSTGSATSIQSAPTFVSPMTNYGKSLILVKKY